MLSIEMEIIAVIILAALTCSISGAFIVLRNDYYCADTASRSSFLGIVIAFALAGYIFPPFVMITGAAAAMAGTLPVKKISDKLGTETENISSVIAPAMLCAGIIPALNIAGKSDFDISSMYLGETAFTYFDRVRIFGTDIGSYAFYCILAAAVINIALVSVFYKRFKLDAIDRGYALSVKMNIKTLDLVLVIMTSLSVAVSFQTAGVFITSAFLLGPAAIARFYTKKLSTMALVSAFVCLVSCLAGFGIAWSYEVSISGTISVFIGIFFVVSVISAPEEGIAKKYMDKLTYRKRLEEFIVMNTILNNKVIKNPESEFYKELAKALNWKPLKASFILNKLQAENKLAYTDGCFHLTDTGIALTNEFLSESGACRQIP